MSQKANYGGTIRNNTSNFVIGNYVYVGLGYSDSQGYLHDIWQYNPSTDSWSQSTTFPGSARFHASAFVFGCQHI